MKAITFHGPRDVRVETLAEPELQTETGLILRVTRSTICGSDLHLWHGAMPALETGFTIGHELVGVVEKAGSAVRTLAAGDRAFVSGVLGCGSCVRCRRGLFSACSVTTAGGTRSNVLGFSSALPGGQAEFIHIPFADTNVFRIPDDVSDEQALFLTDILPTAYMATDFAEVQPGSRVVVFGCGPVGALVQRCAQVRGAAQVIAVDPDEGRLKLAEERGCTVLQPEKENVPERVFALTGGEGADSVIEAVGRAELIAQAALLLRPGGVISVAGVVTSNVELPWALFLMKNLSLRGGLVNPQQYVETLLALIQSGRLDPAELVTHRMPLSEGPAAYELFASHADGVMKVVLEP
jgi:2-desacetyl-2-hydroxyethyl bacteriochlorophyllide A dehydrogenase